ncbi:MAG TPA: hypothetical protein PLL69_00670 [Gemmatimonadales bacterium]|nr:hypothetical protein [Gemmatimonadales bacterium]
MRYPLAIASATAAMFILGTAPLEAQIGGLIRRATQRAVPAAATGAAPGGAQDVYTEHLLELTPDVLGQVITGKLAGRPVSSGPEGPTALRQRREQVQARAFEHGDKYHDQISRGRDMMAEHGNCTDSAYNAIQERMGNEIQMRMMSDVPFATKMSEITQRMSEAHAQGDTAGVRKATEELKALAEPSAADSANVRRACTPKGLPPEYQQFVAMEAEIKELEDKQAAAANEVARLEMNASGLTRRQLAMACERITLYLEKLADRKPQQGFSATELEALEQRRSDLDGLCT